MTPNARKNAVNRSKYLIVGRADATRGKDIYDVKFDKQYETKMRVRKMLASTTLFEKIWYCTFILAGLLCLVFIRPLTFPLVFAVVSMILYMLSDNMVANGNRFGFLISIFSSVLYCIDCFVFKIYGEVFINVLIYIPIYICSYISFGKAQKKEGDKNFLEVKKLKAWQLMLCVLLLVVGSYVVYLILTWANSSLALLNALSRVSFLISMMLSARRYVQCWWFDCIGNVFTILLWVFASARDLSSLPFVLSTISGILNAVFGIVVWQRLYRKSMASKGVILNKRPVKISRIIKVRRKYKKLIWDKKIDIEKNT